MRRFLLILALAVPASSADVTVRRVADASVALPGVTGRLHGFHSPAIRNGVVAFNCFEENWQRHTIFRQSQGGTFQRVATTGESQVNAATLSLWTSGTGSAPKVRADGSVIFEGIAGGKSVIASWQEGALTKLFALDDAVAVVGGGAKFDVGPLTLTDDDRAVRQVADAAGNTVLIQERGGVLSVFQRANVPLPPDNRPGFQFIHWSAFREGVVFHEIMTTDRFCRRLGSQLEALGQDSVFGAFPGLPGEITAIHGLKASQRLTVMQGRRRLTWPDDLLGIYGWAGGRWFIIAEEGMPAPGGGIYTTVGEQGTSLSLEGGTLIFHAYTSKGTALFMYRAGRVTPLVKSGQTLEGGTLATFGLGGNALSGKDLAFCGFMTNEAQHGVYVADLSSVLTTDEPATLPVTAEHGPGRQVTLTVPAKDGHVYYLHRSTDMSESTIVDQKSGSGEPLTFRRDDSDSPDHKAFFWVEEVAM